MLPVPVSESLCRFTGSQEKVSRSWESFVEMLNSIYGLNLTAPQLSGGDLSKFCSGLAEGDLLHPWRDSIRHLSAQSRFGFAHSLFLFRKVIPKEKPLLEHYVHTLSTRQDEPDADFVSFARRQVQKLFPLGWDKKYVDYCFTSSLPLTSCSERGRRDGGSRGWLAEGRAMTRHEFCSYVIASVAPSYRGVSKVMAIETGGKWRQIAIPPVVDNYLRPLHKAMYSHLSHFPWLLRGDAKPSRFKDFVPREGEVFVSGDYESATDNLNSVTQLAIMEELLSRSTSVPAGVAEHAMDIYSSSLVIDKHCGICGGPCGGHAQRRGQLMGQLTSFPLLCLVNYITFRYCIRRPVPVRINGDDIVFRATPDEFARWERGVAKGGLRLSRGKTLVRSRAFTINSTPFWSTGQGGRPVGFVRAKALFPHGNVSEQVSSMNGRFYSSCFGYGGVRTRVVRTYFLHHNQKPIHLSRRSVSRGLGMAVDQEMLRAVGLWHRELFYLEHPVERLLPYNPRVGGPVPDGWVQVSASWLSPESVKEWRTRWGDACVQHAWNGNLSPCEVSEDTIIAKIREGCTPYGLGTLMSQRVRRMMRMSRNQAWRWVNLRRNESVFGRVRWGKGKGVWVRVDLLERRSQVAFLAAEQVK
jgi:hypothetical protein